MPRSTTVTAELLHGRTHGLYAQTIHCTGSAAAKERGTEFPTTGTDGRGSSLGRFQAGGGGKPSSLPLSLHCPCPAPRGKMQEGFSHLRVSMTPPQGAGSGGEAAHLPPRRHRGRDRFVRGSAEMLNSAATGKGTLWGCLQSRRAIRLPDPSSNPFFSKHSGPDQVGRWRNAVTGAAINPGVRVNPFPRQLAERFSLRQRAAASKTGSGASSLSYIQPRGERERFLPADLSAGRAGTSRSGTHAPAAP